MNKKPSLAELHKKAYDTINNHDNFNHGEFEDIYNSKYEYEDFETFQKTLIKKENDVKKEIDEDETLDNILQFREQYRKKVLLNKVYQQSLKGFNSNERTI